MSARKDGGPAFARPAAWFNGTTMSRSQDGMTLRDYFAAKAPITVDDAMVAAGADSSCIGTLPRAKRIEVLEVLAAMRLEYADAMLAAREAS